ncbi:MULTISPECIES: DUF4097 family beta strand repeat-containing protein [Paenibacillus]|uniref:DUF4097 family beta strand repeat-containing protein n=1 Tax=Paenibacillus alvei TaxID=44250 RepID=A0ABT4EB83_PAEAL|nr:MULTISPECIES: DUF4097 family beta strand repeat-containing protein [Paenibacillus]MCY9529611.1 DUF4097 family beta strand repeat-containing protein [Paenibacillus alvei]SDF78477.1 Putative adhesin [Paenibacillus sp. cl6col]
MVKVGRITASLLLVAVGIMLLSDQLFGYHTLRLLLTWWPLLFIIWGIEYIWTGVYHSKRGDNRRLCLDFLGMFVSVFIAVSVFMISQPSLFRDWVRGIQFDFSMMKEMAGDNGINVRLPKLEHSISGDISKLVVRNNNGEIRIQTGNVENMDVELSAIVSGVDREQAQSLANQSGASIDNKPSEHTLTITANGSKFAVGNRPIRIDMIITIPAHVMWKTDVMTNNGDIAIHDMKAEAVAKSNNGDIKLLNIEAPVQGETLNGNLFVQNIRGDAKVSTMRGDITMYDISGKSMADTKSGDIDIHESAGAVQAETLSGDMLVESENIGGNWKLQNMAGDTAIGIPEGADVTLQAMNRFGDIDIDSDFPFHVVKNKVEGTIGNATYQVNLDTNGDISIRKR